MILLLFACVMMAACTSINSSAQKKEEAAASATSEFPSGTATHSSGSTNTVTSYQEYFNWVRKPENGLEVSKKLGIFEYTLRYKPVLYEVLFTAGRTKWNNRRLINERVKDLSSQQFFLFTIKVPTNEATELLKINLTSEEEYKERVNYCSFHIQEDLFLVDGNDTLPCSFAHFERAYNNASLLQFSLAFPSRSQQVNNKIFICRDRLFDMGQINIRIPKEVLSQIPNVNQDQL
ncbi:MAG: hypothetical protein K1X81_01630 [Bacteroidia bacterium]|nr:hypothetical protein [Bacteroidia bacterium]